MPPRDPLGRRGRLLAVAVLLGALVVLLVGYGAVASDPAATADYPDEDDVGPDPDAYVGDRVVLGGEVVATDPVTLEVASVDERAGDAAWTVVVEGADAALRNTDGPIEPGDEVVAFGTLASPATLDAERTIARAPWERWYMYAVSFLGGLWVFARLVRGWRLDRDRLVLVPRERADPDAHARDDDATAERPRDDPNAPTHDDTTAGGDP